MYIISTRLSGQKFENTDLVPDGLQHTRRTVKAFLNSVKGIDESLKYFFHVS